MESTKRSGGLLGPLILISLGVIFLLNNLGVLGWGVWDLLFRLWPLLLIAIGLDILIGRRSAVGSLLVVLILCAIVAMAAWGFSAWSASGDRVSHETISQPLGNASQAEVEIGAGVGTLRIAAATESAGLVEGTISLGSGERVTREASVSGNMAVFRLISRSVPVVWPFSSWRGEGQLWDLKLSREVPMRLRLSTGVGKATLDLSQLRLMELDVNTGVGETRLTLPAQGRLDATVNGGIGETVIVIPQGMAVRIRARAGIGNRLIPAGYQREGDYYYSPGYSTAENRIDLHVNTGIGRVVIQAQ